MTARRSRTHHIVWLAAAGLLLLGLLPATASAKGGPELWVNGQDTNQIFVLNGSEVVDTIQLAPGTGPHMTRFSPDGAFAYVAGITSGDLVILDATTHEVVQRIDLGASGVHEAVPSPDGQFVYVAQQATRQLIRIAADTESRTWTVDGSLTLSASPVCTILIPGTQKAYVTLSGQDIAVVELATMQRTGTVDINGQARCNYDWTRNGKQLYVTSENGTDSFLYVIDPTTDTPTLLHTFAGVRDLHTPVVSANGKQVRIIGRGNDRFYTVTLTDMSVTSFEIGTAGVTDQPDGMEIIGNTAYINLKTSGRLAILRLNQGDISYVDLVAPWPNAALNVVRRPE